MEFAEGINLLTGENGSGKTELLVAIYSLFCDEKLWEVTDGETKTVSIKAQIAQQKKQLFFEKRYQKNTVECITHSFKEMAEMTGTICGQVYFIHADHSYRSLSEADINNTARILQKYGSPIFERYQSRIRKDGKYSLLSGGEQEIIRLLSALSGIPDGSVVLMDEPCCKLDENLAREIFCIIEQMKGIQFLIAAPPRTCVSDNGYHQFRLDTIGRNRKNDFWIDRQKVSKRLLRLQERKQESDHTKIVKYQIHCMVEEEENRYTEFKEIKGRNPCRSMIDTAEIYIVAFLNSLEHGPYSIKWGISDQGEVVGVALSREDKDTIRRELSERLNQIRPYLPLETVHIYFERIIDDQGELLPQFYVVEIHVERMESEELFSTSKGEVYMKTEGGKRKLDIQEVQMELKKRLGK